MIFQGPLKSFVNSERSSYAQVIFSKMASPRPVLRVEGHSMLYLFFGLNIRLIGKCKRVHSAEKAIKRCTKSGASLGEGGGAQPPNMLK